MLNGLKSRFGFNDFHSKVAEMPASAPAQHTEANDSSSQNKAAPNLLQQNKKVSNTVSVLHQKFGVSMKDFSFVPKDKSIFIESKNGHFYPASSKCAKTHQKESQNALSFTKQGLINLQSRYDEIHGAPAFVHSFLKMDNFSHHLHDMVKNPALYPYFKEENFLVMSNMAYDPEGDRHISLKSQKLKDHGVTACAWFIHPHLSSINDDTRTLLQELSEGNASPKPFIEKLRTQCESSTADISKQKSRDENTIGRLRQSGEYLASVMDLNASHIPSLKSLKEKTMRHLAETYGVNDDDDVSLYFHFPYSESTLTLHLHIRVNHGGHPFEEAKSFTLDEIISELSHGKTIEEMILEKQAENNGHHFKLYPEKIFENMDGVTMIRDYPNTHKLDPAKSDVKAVYSRDDLFNLENRAGRPLKNVASEPRLGMWDQPFQGDHFPRINPSLKE